MSFLAPKPQPVAMPIIPEAPPPPILAQSPQGIKPSRKPAQATFLGPEMLPTSSPSTSETKSGKTLLGA